MASSHVLINKDTYIIERYFFRYRAPTRITFGTWPEHQDKKPKGCSFNFRRDRAKIVVYDHILPTLPAKTHFGIGFDIIIDSNDLNTANQIVETVIHDLIIIFSFSEACFVGEPEFVLRYELPIEGLILNKALVHVLDSNLNPKETSTRPIDRKRLQKVFNMINGINDKSIRNRIKDSLLWYWKALYDKKIFDSFLHIWIAIEFLESELKKLYSLKGCEKHYPICSKCKNEFELCPTCEQDFSYKANTGFIGYKKLEVESGLSKGLFKKLHKTRSILVHDGIRTLNSDNLRKSIALAQDLLFKAIYVLCGRDHAEAIEIPRAMRGESLPNILTFEGQMFVSKIPTLNDVELQPYADGVYKFSPTIASENGDLINNLEVPHKFHGVFEKGKMEKKIRIDQTHSIQEIIDYDN